MTTVTARERLVLAAVEAFAEKGFTATTTRDIASRAGMSPAAVYVHHDSKEDLLFHVSLQGHRSALTVVETASAAESEPVARLRRLVHDFSLWHAVNSRVGRIVQYEFHALTDAHRAEIADLRRDIEHVAQQVLRAGTESGAFHVDDLAGTARSILSLSIDLVRWFDQERPDQAEQVAALHADLAERMVAAR
ncbi:MAG: TetR/AcrR family transcriptional regulator [Actinomycetales bacterium]|nr:MAG: TetR/AcrR family transcriptional regulator [Actinomycetales bacterium]